MKRLSKSSFLVKPTSTISNFKCFFSISSKEGRNCPLSYRYKIEEFEVSPIIASTIYVIGGLYGNVPSLEKILEMKIQEEKILNSKVDLIFNGDFNWFNIDDVSFQKINQTVFQYKAIKGNVEEELYNSIKKNRNLIEPNVGCGCSYPEYVGDKTVQRSNEIIKILKETSRKPQNINLTQSFGNLSKYLLIQLQKGDTTNPENYSRIGILHGDTESLSGWKFSVEVMEPLDFQLRKSFEVPSDMITSQEYILKQFQKLKVDALAVTHTCLPFSQDFYDSVNLKRYVIVNNGSSGMPNFANTSFGLLSRISLFPLPTSSSSLKSLYSYQTSNLYFDSLIIEYDSSQFIKQFLSNWSSNSPAYLSYFGRIQSGPNFQIHQAVRGNFKLNSTNF